jgi:predicted ABC-type ATPase
VYFWLNSPDLAISRVKARVAEGGHHIPEDVIRRRYRRGIQNLLQLFVPVCDDWTVVDNSQDTYLFVAQGKLVESVIYETAIWNQLTSISHE